MEDTKQLLEQIENIKAHYYEENNKYHIFKQKQKLDCAEKISTQIDLQKLLDNTVFIIPNTSHILFNYPTFKSYAHPRIYDAIIKHAIDKLDYCIQTYGSYEMHLNLDSFSMSAVKRYNEAIYKYCNACLERNSNYYKKITNMHIYNVPSVIDNIAVLLDTFIHPEVKTKIVKYTREESNIVLPQLYAMINNGYHKIEQTI